MYDVLEVLENGTVIQHGQSSDRIYLMTKGYFAGQGLAENLILRAEVAGYSKIVAKVSASDLAEYVDFGFEVEGYIPDYYPENIDMFFVAYYLDSQRRTEESLNVYETVFTEAHNRKNDGDTPGDIVGCLRECVSEDIGEMVELYKKVFPTYPFPIFESEYLKETMDEHIDYYCVEAGGRIVALASAEIDYKAKSAEMTDFATLPEYTGKGYASRLLSLMESGTSRKGITTFYTIARARSYGMNIVFSKAGYWFGGRLKNNTNISGSIESMNIWYKDRANN